MGVQLRDGTLVQLSINETPDMVKPYITMGGADLSEDDYLLFLKKSKGADSPSY